MEKKLNDVINILNSILSSLPPIGIDEQKEIKEKLAEIQSLTYTAFCTFNKECIDFSELDHTKKLLSQVAFLTVRCLSLVEYLEHSHSRLCNQEKASEK
jgi:hypothetical protein